MPEPAPRLYAALLFLDAAEDLAAVFSAGLPSSSPAAMFAASVRRLVSSLTADGHVAELTHPASLSKLRTARRVAADLVTLCPDDPDAPALLATLRDASDELCSPDRRQS